MSEGIELGTAYVSIVGSTRGLEKDIQNALNGQGRVADAAGKDIGQRLAKSASGSMRANWRPGDDIMAGIPDTKLDRIGARMGQVVGKGIGAGIKVGIAGGALAATGAVAALGYTLQKGFQRLESIDQAKFKLKALGNSAQDVQTIMDSALKSVKGTAFSMDQAATTAAAAVAAGIKPGEQLTKYLSDAADAAAVAGTNLADMGSIFNKIQTQNKAYTDDLQMLSDRGIPIFTWLRDEYGVTADALTKMVQNGEVDAAHFQKAIDEHIGGAAQKMGQSFSGAVENMQAAVARVGADFLTAIFGGEGSDALAGPTAAIGTITTKLDELDAWVKGHQQEIKQFFTNVKDVAADLVSVLGKITQTLTDHPALIKAVAGTFVAWESIKGVAALTTALTSINTLLGVTLPASAASGAGLISSALAGIAIPATLGGLLAGGAGSALLNEGKNVPTLGSDGTIFDPLAPGGQGGVLQGDSHRDYGGGDFGVPGIMPGGGGRGWMNGAQASQYLDQVTGKTDPLTAYAQSAAHGQKYEYGGVGIDGMFDCSGIASALYAKALGLPGGKRYFTTDSDFAALGFQPGFAAGALNIGTNGGSGENGHMAVTLPNGVNVESSGSKGTNYGGPAIGAQNFGQQWHLPLGGYAAGGAVSGAGSGTSDSIPALLSNGEHVLSAADVKALGGQNGAYALREAIHFASGGAVLDDMRTKGYIPAGAGSTAKAGDSTIAKAIGIGGEVINGLIDQAASAASTAASLGVNAVAPGAGGAAGGLTSAAIGLGTNAAKTGVTTGFKELGILADSVLMQFMPFGQPRWMSTDPSAFMPQQAIVGALGDLMTAGTQQAVDKAMGGNGVDPNTTQHGMGAGAPPGPELFTNQANSFLNTQSLSPDVQDPGQQQPTVKIDTVYAKDDQAMAAELAKRQQLAAMQYTGRPTGR